MYIEKQENKYINPDRKAFAGWNPIAIASPIIFILVLLTIWLS